MEWLLNWFAGVSLFVNSLLGQYTSVSVPPQELETRQQQVATESHSIVDTATSSLTASVQAKTVLSDAHVNIAYRGELHDGTYPALISSKYYASNYYSDEGHIYIASTTPTGISYIIVPTKRSESFNAISRDYGTDGHVVYYRDKEIAGADPSTFYVINGCGWLGIDANHRYDNGKLYSQNPDSTPDPTISSKAGREIIYVGGDC